jgi:phosphopantothenoylcysteine decarboxylase/phosphopantothenate--cysteine ligase
MTLRGRKILLAVCGSIAAYKSALIVRLLKKQGAEVRVIMTPSALGFITPLTLSTLSENPTLHSFTEGDLGEWNNHVELALWADILLIAPASENTIGKMVHGICDNLVLAAFGGGFTWGAIYLKWAY